MSDLLVRVLRRYIGEHLPPDSRWLFPSPVKPGRHYMTPRVRKGKQPAEGEQLDQVNQAPNAMRHSFKTTLVQLGAPKWTEHHKILMGHTVTDDIGGHYLTISPEVLQSLRKLTNKVSSHYLKIIPELADLG